MLPTVGGLGFIGGEPIGVYLNEFFPFIGEIILLINSADRADGGAKIAIDALIGIDIKLRSSFESALIFSWMNTIHWTYINTCRIFRADARLSNDVSHRSSSSRLTRETSTSASASVHRIGMLVDYGDDFCHAAIKMIGNHNLSAKVRFS